MDAAETFDLPQHLATPTQELTKFPQELGTPVQELAKLPQESCTPAQDSTKLPQDLIFVDLETTGGNAACHRITEVGIVRMQNGAIVEEWSSLVNPDCRIPSYIEGFTGITNEMVADAPRFADIATLVLEKLQSPNLLRELPNLPAHRSGLPMPIFVAHNARFDYSFLRTEFRRLDVHFSARVLCTVRLSRRLFPEYPRHSLDAVMERHQLSCTARHRALGDARVLGDFWSKLLAEVPEAKLAAAVQAVVGANKLPAYLPADLADELPEGPGVYRFFGEDGVLLYIGKSHSLRTRVLGHFVAEHSDAKEQKKARQVRRIDWVETAGDLGAQLKEAEWIRVQKPLYNKRPKQQADSFTLKAVENAPGVELAAILDLEPAELNGCFGVFHSKKDGRKALTDIARAHSLCLKILGLEDGAGSCFAYQVGKCKGACIGKEPLMLHNMRLQLALSALKLKPWPFPGRIALREGHSEYHVLDHWAYLGTARSEEELAELAGKEAHATFDVDVYRILVRHFARNAKLDWHDLCRRAICP
jgi:DNA polymerase III subunit epsilon